MGGEVCDPHPAITIDLIPMKKKILVTGATGFIGNYIIQELLNGGHQVLASSTREEKARESPWFDQVQYRALDLAEFDPARDYFRFFDAPDRMIHLAWEGLPHYKSSFHLDRNFPRHAAFLENLIFHGLGNLTVTGTCLEYGMQEGCLREDLPALPNNPYGLAKDALRKFLDKLEYSQPFVCKWVRLFYMYGKGQNPNSLLSQLDRAISAGAPVFNMSGGEQERDFLPVEQVANHIVGISLQDKIQGIINCCSGRPVRVKDFVLAYLREKKVKLNLNLGYYPYPDYEPMRFWGDVQKLNKIEKQL
jgi:nucleoside-diphosphate-sugar epimerase